MRTPLLRGRSQSGEPRTSCVCFPVSIIYILIHTSDRSNLAKVTNLTLSVVPKFSLFLCINKCLACDITAWRT
ncbi:hypothetical protein ACFX12_004028 [Malus domestica]